MTKAELIQMVADRTSLKKDEAGRAIDATLDAITETLQAGDSISFPGFGKFSTSHRSARTSANPQRPGQTVYVPARTVPRFSSGSRLKQAVR